MKGLELRDDALSPGWSLEQLRGRRWFLLRKNFGIVDVKLNFFIGGSKNEFMVDLGFKWIMT